MQGRIQKWVDHSISVTVNLPADVTEEMVNRLYVEAWRSGCKGCTVYRDGSRSGVLVSLESKKKKSDSPAECSDIHPLALKRPIELEADVVRFQNNKEKWVAFVGLLDNHPYEIFTGVLDDVWLAFPIAEVVCLISSLFFLKKVLHRLDDFPQ